MQVAIELVIAGIAGQLAVVGLLLRWMHMQIRDNTQSVEKVVKGNYTKIETKELIELMVKPIELGIIHVQRDLQDVKAMLMRLLDEKNK